MFCIQKPIDTHPSIKIKMQLKIYEIQSRDSIGKVQQKFFGGWFYLGLARVAGLK